MKPTNQELEQRIDSTIELLTQGLRMSQIKTELRERFGSLSARTVFSYVARARASLLKESGQTREELRAESFAFYQSVISNPKATLRERILARERIDKIFGVESIEVSGMEQEPGKTLIIEVVHRQIAPDVVTGPPHIEAPDVDTPEPGEKAKVINGISI